MRLPLAAAILLLLAGAVAVSIVPVGIGLDARVTSEMRRVAVEDLGRAPMILEDRNAAQIEALSMHAMTVAGTDGLESALRDGRSDVAEALARGAAEEHGEDPVLISPAGEPIVGPAPGATELATLRRDRTWAGYVWYSGMPRAVGLAAIGTGGIWSGAAGSMTTFGEDLAATLSGLARADVTVLGRDGSVVASTADTVLATALGLAVSDGATRPESDKVGALTLGEAEYWVAEGELPGAGRVLFSRSVAEELAALPGIRRSYAVAGLIALLLALGVGGVAAVWMSRPVRALAVAADRVAAGDFTAPVPTSRVGELERLGGAFRAMRNALRHRLTELAEANEALEERQQKLTALQAELIRQDRLESSARMVAELAHEIRNPVANVRNCLEVVRRRLADDPEGARFTDMAIDELLRMHELAEGLLDLHRPAPAGDVACDAAKVAGQVAALARVGGHPVSVRVDSGSEGTPLAAIPPDALKQILLNLVLNAAEAGDGDATVDVAVSRRNGTVLVDVLDDGPGIPEEVLDRLFDPFFTTKGGVTGVGLGLFVAEGLARRYGGRLDGANRTERPGAHFTIELPVAERSPAGSEERP
ncbi:MAG: HAMP domain-containing sensor histidine kinase [Gemmatimonadota bacterium]